MAHAAALAPDRAAALVLAGPTTDPRSAGWARLVGRWSVTAALEPAWQVPSLVPLTHGSLVARAVVEHLTDHGHRPPLTRW